MFNEVSHSVTGRGLFAKLDCDSHELGDETAEAIFQGRVVGDEPFLDEQVGR